MNRLYSQYLRRISFVLANAAICMAVVCLFFLNSPITHSDTGYIFTSSLKYGSNSEEVRQLQIVLNKDSRTAIAQNGPGSAGNETTHFGQATFNAVINFQNLYYSDIVSPAGLTSATGYVGALTLKKLNTFSSSDSQNTIKTIPISNVQSSINTVEPLSFYQVTPTDAIDIYQTDEKIAALSENITQKINSAIASKTTPDLSDLSNIKFTAVTIFQISAHSGGAGTNVTISGRGFTSNNTIYFGPHYLIKNIPSNGTTLSFTVPPLPVGRYDIVVSNNTGISSSIFFVVTSASTPSMAIYSVSPQVVSYGGQLTITGTGFTPIGNEIVTPFQKYENVPSSDGKTLSVTIAPESFSAVEAYGNQGKQFPNQISVINDNGFSKNIQFKISY